MHRSDEPWARLFQLPRFGTGLAFHRILWVCRELVDSSWAETAAPLRVTGSNGKGSVVAMVAAILEASGFRSGLFSSPHLLHCSERILVGGVPVPDELASQSIEWFFERRHRYQELFPDSEFGAFEALTSIALHRFHGDRVEAPVLEAGLGGRYDPTRIARGLIVGLTSLDLEHTELLGESLEKIAYDKADLCPDGGVLVVGPVPKTIEHRLEAYCSVRRVRPRFVSREVQLSCIDLKRQGLVMDLAWQDLDLRRLEVALAGRHQAWNAAAAVILAWHWLEGRSSGASLPGSFEAAVRTGLAQVRWPGRFERVRERPEVYLDVGHTPGAVETVVATARDVLQDKPILLVTGCSYDKQLEEIVGRLACVADRILCTRAHHKGAAPELILETVRACRPEVPASIIEPIERAVESALSIAVREGMVVLVGGGLFLAMEARQVLEGGDPRLLRFL